MNNPKRSMNSLLLTYLQYITNLAFLDSLKHLLQWTYIHAFLN